MRSPRLQRPVLDDGPSSNHIVILAGAGASYAVSPPNFPTAAILAQHIPESVRQDSLLDAVRGFLSDVHRKEQADIEDLLFCLGDLEKYLETTVDPRSIAGYLMGKGRLDVGSDSQHRAAFRFHKNAQQLRNAARALQLGIEKIVHDYYDYWPTTDELSANWIPLLAWIMDRFPSAAISLFTLNYDRVVEAALEEAQRRALLEVKSQYVRRGGDEVLATDLWSVDSSGEVGPRFEREAFLTKLHGSIDWSFGSGNSVILHSGPIPTLGRSSRPLLYPGFKASPDSEPFFSFHRYLDLILRKASFLVVIGYAFRDGHVNGVLRRSLRSDASVMVINPEQLAERMPFESGRVLQYSEPSGFSEESIRWLEEMVSEA